MLQCKVEHEAINAAAFPKTCRSRIIVSSSETVRRDVLSRRVC